jgi:AhpC/TSA family
VVLFHRGSWWPYCDAQLAAFARAADKFAGGGVKFVAVSVDDQEKSETLVEKHRLGFAVAYGANARAVSAVTGAFVMTIPCVPRQAASSSIPRAGRWRPSIRPTRSPVLCPTMCSALSATSNLWQRTDDQRQISGEVDEWRSRF